MCELNMSSGDLSFYEFEYNTWNIVFVFLTKQSGQLLSFENLVRELLNMVLTFYLHRFCSCLELMCLPICYIVKKIGQNSISCFIRCSLLHL